MFATELEGTEIPKPNRLEALFGASHDLVWPREIAALQ